jgi:tRNA 5-methylaminomethyl-2-thiouridine biosynthesis bifunctional protein
MSLPCEPLASPDLVWRDGLPYSLLFDDIYFSATQGLLEANHVFIEGNQLVWRWQLLPSDESCSFVIGELGFGTGLNALLAWSIFQRVAPPGAKLHVFSAEKHPLSRDELARCLALWPELSVEADALLAVYPTALTPGFHVCSLAEGRFQLTLMLGDALESFESLLVCGDAALERSLRTWTVDAWFLDGFSPAKNPAMWTPELFFTLGLLSAPGATASTFSAAGVVKRGLQSAGFHVIKSPGFGRKREMIRATFDRQLVSHQPRHIPWHVSGLPHVQDQRALVLGAGLAGCMTASALARRGWHVTIVDACAGVGMGASGNRQAVLFPTLSAHRQPLTMFMQSAFLFAARTYARLMQQHAIRGQLTGLLQLIDHEKIHPEWLSHYPALGRWVDAKEASQLAGIWVETGGLFIPQAGWMDSRGLCQALIQSPQIECVFNQRMETMDYRAGQWHVGGQQAPVLIIATGDQTAAYPQTEHLPLKSIRGQMTSIASNQDTSMLNIPLCAEGHVSPAEAGRHWVGATYQPGGTNSHCLSIDDDENLKKWEAFFPLKSCEAPKVTGHWAGIRAATPDYLPLVGPVADVKGFNEQYQALKSHATTYISAPGVYQPGLYVCAGFGSRGLSSIPLCAEYLAASIHQEPFGMPRAMIQSISPARFLRRALTRPR